MRDLVVHAWTSLDGYSCDEETEMFRVMGEIDDPVGDDLFARRLWGAGAGFGCGRLMCSVCVPAG